MAGAHDTAADDGQPITTIENTIAGPGPPLEAVGAMVRKCDEPKHVENPNTSRRTFQLPQAAQKTLLLMFAPEIRNMIFEHCLVHPDDIGDKLKLQKRVEDFTMATYYPKGDPRPKLQEAYESSFTKRTKKVIREHSLRSLALMRTCQAIYNAAAPVFWGQRFTFETILQLQTFLLSSDVRHDLVRDIRVWSLGQNVGINYMPAICILLQDKAKGLERLEIDMGHLREYSKITDASMWSCPGFRDDEHLRMAAKNLGFGIYSCMHPWVTKVVQEQGMERMMSILQIVRESDPISRLHGNRRVHRDFQGRGQLTPKQLAIADTATAWEIVRLIDVYEKKL